MPRIQIAKEDHGKPGALRKAIERRHSAVTAAIAAERERCARIVENYGTGADPQKAIAAAIRDKHMVY